MRYEGGTGLSNGPGFFMVHMKDWDELSTIALLALLIGVAMGTISGYSLALDLYPHTYECDNDIRATSIDH